MDDVRRLAEDWAYAILAASQNDLRQYLERPTRTLALVTRTPEQDTVIGFLLETDQDTADTMTSWVQEHPGVLDTMFCEQYLAGRNAGVVPYAMASAAGVEGMKDVPVKGTWRTAAGVHWFFGAWFRLIAPQDELTDEPYDRVLLGVMDNREQFIRAALRQASTTP